MSQDNEHIPVPKWIVWVVIGLILGIGACMYFSGGFPIQEDSPAVIEGPPA